MCGAHGGSPSGVEVDTKSALAGDGAGLLDGLCVESVTEILLVKARFHTSGRGADIPTEHIDTLGRGEGHGGGRICRDAFQDAILIAAVVHDAAAASHCDTGLATGLC